MIIPGDLLRQVNDGSVVLLLGAGASMGATNSRGQPPPTGQQLAELLATRFLGGSHKRDPLQIVAELAISESNLASVQDYIRSIFDDVQPAPFHGLLPTFKWAALATTNYDLV